METDVFLNLDVKHVMEWVSSDDITVSAEEEVFKGIVKWVNHNKGERESDFPDLLRQIRLMFISHDFLVNELVREELITTNIDCLNFVLGSIKYILHPTCESGTKSPRKCLKMHTDVIFVCGGRKAMCYLPQQNMWYEIADMILEHQNHALVQYNDKIYIFDERRPQSGVTPAAEYYMCSSDSWAAMQTKFEYDGKISSLLVLNGSMYALTDDEENHENTVFIYHPRKNEWEVKMCPASGCWGSCGVSDELHLYIIGGTEQGIAEVTGTSKVVRFEGDNWQEVASLNEARHNAFGAALNDKIYVAGGIQRKEQKCTVINTCEVFSPLCNEWELIPNLNVPRHSASMVCFKGALYVVGGFRDNRQLRELSVEVFDAETNEWKRKKTIPTSHESSKEKRKALNYKACFARLHRDVFNELRAIWGEHWCKFMTLWTECNEVPT